MSNTYIREPLPPRLSMDEYADFIETNLSYSNHKKIARQKEIEKKIKIPFRK